MPFSIGAIPPVALVAAAVLSLLAITVLLFLIARLTWRDKALAQALGERLRAAELQQQRQRFAIALNSMTQGIVMFDAAERAVVWNERYLELSGLSAEFMRPERTLREILRARQSINTFQL
ncbi:MAG TPA: PAS-domain containing protein, partial [Rhizomicrobium sp.]